MANDVAKEGSIMGPAELKPLLLLSKRAPVSCAVGLTKDKQGVILLHRRTKPRKLMAELVRQGKGGGVELDRASLRFGRAHVDGGSDSSTVHVTINKASPDALRMKLLEKLRPAGYQRCEITVDAELETESDEDGDEAGTATPGLAAQNGGGEAPGPVPPPPASTATQAAAAAPEPPQDGAPTPAATPASPAGQQPKPNPAVFAKGQAVWLAVRGKLQTDIDATLASMVSVYGDDDPRAGDP